MPKLDTAAARRELDRLRPQIAALRLEPGRIAGVAQSLWALGSEVTAACEAAFLRLLDAPAA